MNIADELHDAARQFECAEFTDDMPIREMPDLLRRAADRIDTLRNLLGEVRRSVDVIGGDQIVRDKCRKAGLTLDAWDQPVWSDDATGSR